METTTYTSSNLHKYITELGHIIARRTAEDPVKDYPSFTAWIESRNPIFTLSSEIANKHSLEAVTVTDPRFAMLSPELQEKTMRIFHATLKNQGIELPEPDGGSRFYIPLNAGKDIIDSIEPAYASALQKTLQEELNRIQQERKAAIEAFKRNAAVFKKHQSALTNALTDAIIPLPDKRKPFTGYKTSHEDGAIANINKGNRHITNAS